MRILSKFVLSIASILAATDISFAQNFSNTPNDTINIVGMMEDLETLSIQQLNISSNTITLKWKKVSESVPLLWDASVCDNQICYTSLVDSGTMNPIYPSGYGFLLLHITPHVNYGTARVIYEVWDVTTPLLSDTLTYILTVNNTSGIAEAENQNLFTVFPNPASDFISINSNENEKFSFSITNSLGETIYNLAFTINHSPINIHNYPKGIYFITLSNSSYRFTQTIIKI